MTWDRNLNESDRAAVVNMLEQGVPRFILEKLPPNLLYALAGRIEEIARERDRELRKSADIETWTQRERRGMHR